MRNWRYARQPRNRAERLARIIDNRAPRIDLRVAATGAAYLDTASNTMRYAVTYQYSARIDT